MRLSKETIGEGDMSWLASDHGIFNCRTSTIAVSNFTQADHYPDGYIPSGTPVDVTDEAAVAPWAGTGKLGFVLTDQRVADGDEQFGAPILRHGMVRSRRLPNAADFQAPADQPQFVFIEGMDNGTAYDGGGA